MEMEKGKQVIVKAANPCTCLGCIAKLGKLKKTIEDCRGVVSVALNEVKKEFTVIGKFEEVVVIKHLRKKTKAEFVIKAINIVEPEDEDHDRKVGNSSPSSSSQHEHEDHKNSLKQSKAIDIVEPEDDDKREGHSPSSSSSQHERHEDHIRPA
ncbi:hypothetical protein RHMOL_Rhmol12G0002400 [Rhododendron molle]|uniref:Uncharacterized protein n=1 Tax=Rhododendron molle TaxID=49168 RepID=A0ACC0LDW2_RHOML|nr:hypothetical protein RHMOL_Rhmol12G0002400 [Rhododendron molle]